MKKAGCNISLMVSFFLFWGVGCGAFSQTVAAGGLAIDRILSNPENLTVGIPAIISVTVRNRDDHICDPWTLSFGTNTYSGTPLNAGQEQVVDFPVRFDIAGWKTARLVAGSRQQARDLYCFMDLSASNRYDLPSEVLNAYFKNPPNEYRLTHYTHSLDTQTVDQFRKYGIGRVQAMLAELLYPSQKWPELRTRVKYADQNGLKLWLGDDFGYPSGMAGGRVVEANPDYEARGLVQLTLDGTGSDAVTFNCPDDVERIISAVIYPLNQGRPDFTNGIVCPVTDRQVVANGISGEWRLCVFSLKIINQDSQAQSTVKQFHHTGHYPNLLDPDAMKSFIHFMHETYKVALQGEWSAVEGIYLNEPSLMQLNWKTTDRTYAYFPWEKNLPATFMRMHGYDPIPRLGALYFGDDLDSRRFRMHFQQTVAEMLAHSFTGQIAAWCRDNGIESGGHFLLEEYPTIHVANYGDLMKVNSELDVPGMDTQIPNPGKMTDFPFEYIKYFSSGAAWKHRDTVSCLMDPIVGGNGLSRLSPGIPLLRNTANMACLYGATKISTYVYLTARPGKGVGNGYSEQEYTALSDYIGRMAVMLRGAENATSVALYYPIAMFQADYKSSMHHWTGVRDEYRARQDALTRITDALLSSGCDYNFVHPEAVASAQVADGSLVVSGHAYRYLVMPQMEMIPLPILEKITEFEKNGGVVLWVDEKPAAGAYAPEDDTVRKQMRNLEPIRADQLPKAILNAFDRGFTLEITADRNVAVARFNRRAGRVYDLVNRDSKPARIQLSDEDKKQIQTYDPLTGNITALDLPASVEIPAYTSLILVDQ